MKPEGKKRVNMTIAPSLHEWAVEHASEDGTDFSGFVSALIAKSRRELAPEDIHRAEVEAIDALSKHKKTRARK